MKRLFLADDHPIVLSGLQALLDASGYVIAGTAADGQATLDLLPASRADALIIDVNMPQRGGLDVLRTLRARGDQTPVIFLTALLDDATMIEAIRVGVNGLILKDGSPEIILRCLREIERAGRWIDKALLERALDVMMEPAPTRRDPMTLLTLRERTVAELVAQGKRNRDIAEELRISDGTVKFYLHRIYDKVGVTNRTELALAVRHAAG